MLPCQNTCPHYISGCHKTCSKWKQFLGEQQELYHKKKDYLKMHNEICSAVIRQCSESTLYKYRF
jgi:hypothetical protein